MKASEILIAKIKEFEGLRLKAYKCPAGVWTIGYGHTYGVREGQVITQEDADRFLREDVGRFERQIDRRTTLIGLTQGQQDAVIDFCYNLGVGAFLRSTLCKKIKKNPKDRTIPAEFQKWVHAGGKVLPGLVKRRLWEAQRWQS